MLKKRVGAILSKYDLWRLIGISLGGGITVVAVALVLELVMLLRLDSEKLDTSSTVNTVATNNLPAFLNPEAMGFQGFAKVVRPGLFRAATLSRDKPMADKTIERIISQLKVQCIMELNGEPVAYVNIKGVGLKKCKAGDSVNDLFTVTNIYEKSIEITIVGHKTILSL